MPEILTIKAQITNFPLTDNERYLVETLRSLRPFESITITADKMGKINNFLIGKSQKILLTDNGPIYTG